MAIWTAFELYHSWSAHRPTKIFHLPWEYIGSSMGFWIQESMSKDPQGTKPINTLCQPEIHVTKGMVDERLIEILKSSNVPEPIDTPFNMMIDKFSSNSSKLPLSKLLKVQHHSLWLSVQKHLDPPSYPSPESTARVWSSWCEDNCMNYCQTLWSTYKQSSFDNLHDWLSAQRAEANYDGCGVSFGPEGMSIDGGAEVDNTEDNLSFLEGLHDPEKCIAAGLHTPSRSGAYLYAWSSWVPVRLEQWEVVAVIRK